MQICPFCEFDRGELPLQEGRCPRCANVLDWQTVEQDASNEDASNESASNEGTSNEDASNEDASNEDASNEGASNEGASNDGASNASVTATVLLPTNPTGPNPGLPAVFDLRDEQGPEDHTENDADAPQYAVSSGALAAASHSTSPDSTSSESNGADDATGVAVEKLWRDSISDGVSPLATLKVAESGGSISDSVFSIQQREIRSGNVELGAPVDYQLLEVIGQGGVGVVYAARQSSIDRPVAIKMLRAEYRGQPDHRDKFLAEAVVTGELDHPNIVPIYDLGRSTDGELFYSMKNVVGTPWDRIIAEKTQRENIEILMKVADAVAFAHSRGVVHRDLKPENIMLGSFGEVLVMDWGIALPTAEFRKSSSILRSQAMGGTPAYMAPEMAAGPIGRISATADVYLLGAVLFEIITGMPPHYGNTVMECVLNAAKNLIRPTEVTGELMDIATKAMATVPRRRYRSVQLFQAAIRLYQSHIESITLSDNAEHDLLAAESSKDYQELSRIIFAFREALALWKDNQPAAEGLLRAQLAYASAALEKGDIDLGLSLLTQQTQEHLPLIKKLQAAQKERAARQSRLGAIRKLAVSLVGFILVAGTVALLVILQLFSSVSKSNAQLGLAQQDLELKVISIEKEKQRAEQQTERAIAQQSLAEVRRREAEAAQLESVVQRMKAEESSYAAELGLVSASIEQNGFAIAAGVLASQLESSSKSKLRHWEWGRNWYLIQGHTQDDDLPAVTTFTRDSAIVAIDRSLANGWIAIGTASGNCSFWRLGAAEPSFTLSHGTSLGDLDFDVSGQFLATCGIAEDGVNCIKIWHLLADETAQLVTTIQHQGGRTATVAFSNDADSKFVVADDRQRIGRVWQWRTGVEQCSLLGHVEAITSANFSPDSRWVVTSSLDGSVRVWNALSGVQVQRFTEHQSAVSKAQFSPDGKQIASAGSDRKILLWDVAPAENDLVEFQETLRLVNGEAVAPPAAREFLGHNAAVRDVSFSDDGQLLVSSANDNEVCIWETVTDNSSSPIVAQIKSNIPAGAKTTCPLMRLRGHGGWVGVCCFDVDGNAVLSGADDASWKRWRLDQYREQNLFQNRKVAIHDAGFSPDGNTIATAGADGTVELWDTRSRQSLAILQEGHDYLTNRARFSADGKQLFTAAGDNTLRLWDVAKGTQLVIFDRAGRSAIFSLSHDSRWLIVGGDEAGVSVWDLVDLEATPHRFRPWKDPTDPTTTAFSEPTSVAVSADGSQAIIGTKDGGCEFWDVRTGALRHRVFEHSESVVACYFLPKSATESASVTEAITASADGTVAFWDADTGSSLPRDRLKMYAPIQAAVLSPDGRRLACSGLTSQGNSRMWMWQLASGERIGTHDREGELIQEIAFASGQADSLPENSLWFTAVRVQDSRKEIWNWSAEEDRSSLVGTPAMHSSSLWGAISTPDGKNLLTFGGRGARLWRLQDKSEIMAFRPSSAIRSIAFSATADLLAAGSQDGSIVLWNRTDHKSQRKLFGGHSGSVLAVAFSPDGEKLVSTGADGRLAVWDVATGALAMRLRVTDKTVSGNAVCFFPDGKSILLSCEDRSLRVVDADALELVRRLEGHEGAVTCATVSADGRWIASGSEDKTVKLWSARTGALITTLVGHSAAVESVAFSSDGLRVLTASQDTKVKLWDVDRLDQLVDNSAEASSAVNESDFSEILSLDYHMSEATVAEFSPDGRSVLTAGQDGFAVVWPAERVTAALRLSSPGINYLLESGPTRLDVMASLSLPGAHDLRGGYLKVKLETSVGVQEKLAIDQGEGELSIEGETLIYHANSQTASRVGVIRVLEPDALQIAFSDEVVHAQVRAVVRHITYEAATDDRLKEVSPKWVTFELVDAAGNATSAAISIKPIQSPRDVKAR